MSEGMHGLRARKDTHRPRVLNVDGRHISGSLRSPSRDSAFPHRRATIFAIVISNQTQQTQSSNREQHSPTAGCAFLLVARFGCTFLVCFIWQRPLAYRGTSLTRNTPPVGLYSRPMPLGTYGDPRGLGVSFERGTPNQGHHSSQPSRTHLRKGVLELSSQPRLAPRRARPVP